MKILFAAAEVDPFAKVGGLADVASSLPARLKEVGHDVRVVTPCHASSLEAMDGAPTRDVSFVTPGGRRTFQVASVKGEGGVPVDLVHAPGVFGRAVYGEPDDLERYQLFCRVVLQMLRDDPWTPDILHLNDWHTAPMAFALRNLAWANPVLRGVASVFTIHNLRYRGPDELNDFLSQAIYYSDMVTTVSPTYAKEILTRDFGEGLDALLNLRRDDLRGIINGLNYDVFDPRTDPNIDHHFDIVSLDKRSANKEWLLDEVGLPHLDGPVCAMVTRLTEQKGIDIVLRALPDFVAASAQLIVVGEGDESLQAALRRLEARHPENVRLVKGFDERMARRVYAGCDTFLMPSRYEPCGLGQLIAMRYGAVPIGRRTGGLNDTILDLDDHPETGTGFLFDEFSEFALAGALERAASAFQNVELWRHLQRNGMSRDHSWRASATHYVETYNAALRSKGITPPP